MTSEPLGHGLGRDPVAPDWPRLSEDEVTDVLSRFDVPLPAPRVAWASPRPFSAAALVACGDDWALVKRHARQVRTSASLRPEHDLAARLRSRGVCVPAPYRTATGGTSLEQGPWTYEVLAAAPGVDAYRDALSWTPYQSTAHAWHAGAALARLHRAVAGYSAPARPAGVLTGGCRLATAADLLGALDRRRRARPGLDAALADRPWREDIRRVFLDGRDWGGRATRLRELAPLWGHGDWHPSNLMWSASTPDARVVSVFDFGLADRAFALHDLAIATERACVEWLDLPATGDAAVDLDAMDALLAGYHATSPLTASDRVVLAGLLPVVHIDLAFSELEYFAAVVGAKERADLAYDGYLLGHAAWWEGASGQAALDRLRRGAPRMRRVSDTTDNFIAENPGRDAQRVGTARFLGEDPARIHDPVWAVVGTLGDSQCYVGVNAKVDAIQAAVAERIHRDDLLVRLIPPAFTLGVSDGQLNGTDRMRYSLIGRELVHDVLDLHLSGSEVAGVIAVVACDKPPVGTLAALLEHNAPAVMVPDGPIHPGTDPVTGEPLDIISGFQVAGDPDPAVRARVALRACPGQGSCGGMFTYNTMQTFISVLGMQPLHMVAPPSDDPRRLKEFPDQLVDCLVTMAEAGTRPRDLVTPTSLRNALTVVMAMGGSTNVALHSVEIARAAGIDLWEEVMSQAEFNALSHRLPVLANMRPFGAYSMVDVEDKGGIQAIVKELLDGGLIDGDVPTCTGETLAAQVARLAPPAPDETVIHPVARPYKPTGGLRLLGGNLAPEGGAILKLAGVEGGIEGGVFTGRARVFDGEAALIEALETAPGSFADKDMVVIRYEGPRGAPGMPELLDPTSRITTLCRQRGITIALMTDARFSGGSVGLVIGHVAPEAYLGGPIALIEDGDTIVVDVNTDQLDCTELDDPAVLAARRSAWEAAAAANGGLHPKVRPVDGRMLSRMRATARSALAGGGMAPAG